MRVAALLVFATLAGCAGPDPVPETAPSSLSGWIFDPAQRGIIGATVQLDGNQTTTTDANGYYRFDAIPHLLRHTVSASADGFFDEAASIAEAVPGLDLRLNLTLAPIPEDPPYTEVIRFRGFIGCGLLLQVGHQHGSGNPDEHNDIDCSGGDFNQENSWTFPIKPRLGGAVLEVFWDANTPASEWMAFFIQHENPDGSLELLSFTEGNTGLQGLISALPAAKYYWDDGGMAIATLRPGSGEEDLVVAADVNQEFDVIATLFYNQPVPIGYSIAEAA